MVCGIMVKEHIPTFRMCSEAEYVCMGRCVCVYVCVCVCVSVLSVVVCAH